MVAEDENLDEVTYIAVTMEKVEQHVMGVI